jgi:signal transduction histidine kinase
MNSLKARLIVIASIWVIVGIVLADIALSHMLSNYLTAQFYGDLVSDLKELDSTITLGPNGEVKFSRPLSDANYQKARSGYYWEIQRNGAVVARSASLQGPKFDVPQTIQPKGVIHNHLVEGPTGDVLSAELIHDFGTGIAPVRVIVGSDRQHLDDLILLHFNNTLVWSLGALGLCIIFAAVGLIFYALRTLEQLRKALGDVRGGRKSQVNGRFPSEVQPLVDDLNSMLDATGQLVQRARSQAGNLAHGLKTPLAVLTDEAQRLANSGASDCSSIILDQCQRMQRQIDYQLARARSAAHLARPGTICSPAKISADVVSALKRLHRQRRLIFNNLIDADLTVACDDNDLNEMIANLVDNACKHAAAKVQLTAERSPSGSVQIAIEDDGAGIPEHARETVLTLGERLNEDVGGYGLGLAIVKDLATSYGGNLSLGRSDLGGLKAMLLLRDATVGKDSRVVFTPEVVLH